MASKKKKAVNKISEEERRAIKSSARPGLTAEGTLNAAAKEQARNRNRASEVLQELARKRQAEEQERQARIDRTGIINGRQTGLMTKLGYEDRQKQLQKKIYFDLRGDQLTNPQQTLPGHKFEATGKEFPGKTKSETSTSLPTETKKSWPYVSDEQVQQNWNKYLSEKYAPKQTDKWKGISQDLQHGYEGVFNPQSGKNFELYDAKGNTIPFNAYALKQAGVDVNRARDLADDLYNQYVFNRRRQKEPGEMAYSGWQMEQTQEVKTAKQISTNRSRVDQEADFIRKGRYNGTGNYWRYNEEGLNDAYLQWQNKYNAAEKEIKRLNELTEQGYEQQADRLAWMPTVAADSTKGLYDDLAEMGYGSYLLMDRDAAGQNVTNMYAGGKIPTGDQEAVRMEVFNQLYSNGMQNSYYEITSGMNEEQKAWLDNRLDEIIEGMVNPYETETTDYSSQIANAESEMRYAQGQMESITSQQKWNKKYEDLMAGARAQELTDTGFHPELDKGSDSIFEEGFRTWLVGSRGDNHSPDDLYSFINGGTSYQRVLARGDKVSDNPLYKNAQMMSSEEVAIFNGYYNAGRKEDAMAFYYGLETALTQRYRYIEEINQRELANSSPFWATMKRFGDTVVQPGEFAAYLLGNVLGDEQVKNPYGRYFDATRDKIYTQQYVGEKLEKEYGKGAKFLYDTGMSAGDSFINVVMSGGKWSGMSNKALQGLVLTFFGTQAYMSSLEQSLEETNGNYELSVGMATLDTIIETTTEIATVENLLSDPRNLFRYIAKVSFSEGSEEFTGAVFGPVIKEMILHKNEWKERADEIFNNGYYYKNGEKIPVDNWDDAMRQALREWNHDIFISTASGALSTGGSVFYGGAQHIFQNNQLGRAINSNNVNGEYQATEAMAEAAQKMGVGTESYKAADSVLKRIREGKKPGNFRTGKMVSSTITEANEQINTTVEEVTDRRVMEDLKKQGLEGKTLTDAQDLVMKAIKAGGVENLSKSLQKKLQGNEKAKSVYELYAQNTEESKAAAQEIMEKTTAARGANSVAMALLENQKTKKNVYTGRNVATEDDVRQATGEEVKGPKGIIYNGQHAELGNLKTVTVKDENGKEKTALRYEVRIQGTNETVMAEPTEILTTNRGVAAVIEAQSNLPDFYSQAYTNAMLQEMNNRQVQNNPAGFMQDAMLIRFAAFQQQGMPQTELPQDVADRLYKLAAAEKTANRAKETSAEERNARGKGQGIVHFNGTISGTQEFENELSKLSDADQESLRYITDIATEAGMELTFTDAADLGGIDVYGIEQRKGIRINLEGRNFEKDSKTGKYVPTEKHEYVVTFGHETVHFLQRNSLEGYNKLEKFVLEEQRKKLGTAGLNSRIRDIMDKQNLDLDHAISELVADSMDQIFANEDAVNHIKQENPGLFKQLKNAVHEILQKLKNLMKNSMSEDARRMLNVSAKRIADVFNEAWDEAVSGTVKALQQDLEESNGPETAYGDHEKFSRVVLDKDELNFLNNQETITTYKSMQLIDGKLYPPMAAVVAGNLEDASELGKWEKAVEHPELIKDGNKFTLNKGKGKGSLAAAYNPYMHSSNLMINDQFSGAYNRPNLVTVECEVPVSEVDSGYHAEYAKDTVGWHSWHTGPVAGQLRKENGTERQVFLSRWIKPVRIVSNAEVAQHYKELLNGTDIAVPDNVVTPALREELEKAGVEIQETGKIRYSRKPYPTIKEQINSVRSELNKMDPVKVLSGEIDYTQFRENAEGIHAVRLNWAKKILKGFGTIFRKEIGYFRINENRISEAFKYIKPYDIGKTAAFEAIPDVVEKGLKAGESKGLMINGQKVDSITFAAPVVIGGKRGNMGVTLHKFPGSNVLEAYKVYTPDGKVFVLDNKKETEEALLRVWPVKDQTKSRGATTVSSEDSITQESKENKGRNSRAVLDQEYDQAIKDGDVQRQQELVDQAATEAGYVKAYHGTGEGGFTVFTMDETVNGRVWGDGIYLTSDENEAKWYAGKNGGKNQQVYSTYVNLGDHPLEIDYDEIRKEVGGNPKYIWSEIRELRKAEYGRATSIVMNRKGKTWYIVKDSSQIKSADPVTYDNKGKVIPLSERFNKEEKDIRWSRAQLDKAYDQAIAEGNEEKQRELVKQAAVKAGYNSPLLYHGTREFGFTEYDVGGSQGVLFTTTDRKVAETYSGETKRSRISERTTQSVIDLEGEELLQEAKKHLKQYKDYEMVPESKREEMLKDARQGLELVADNIQDFVKENEDRFDDYNKNKYGEIIKQIRETANAQTDEDYFRERNKLDAKIWTIKFGDEDLFFDVFDDYTNKTLNIAQNRLSDMLYEGNIYRKVNGTNDEYIFDNQLKLELNAELHKGVYELYGKTDNFLIIDANKANWNQIMPPEELNLYGPQRTRDIAAAAKAHGYDGVLIRNVKDSGGETAYNWPSDVYMFFDANQLKSADPVTYDDAGNVIPLSERFNSENDDIRWSKAAIDKEYMDAVESGNEEKQNRIIMDTAARYGYTIPAYHGTGRADRVGTVFLPERATSGPMAFFTDNRDIAENYARDKKDTSIAYDEEYGDYHTQFRYNLNGKNIPVSKLWDSLNWKSRQQIIDRAKHINFDDELEDIIYDEDAQYGPGGFTENELRFHKGNAIDTLVYVWLDSANLYNREEDFLKVLELAGIKGVTWNNPDARYEKVYDTLLKIKNPFDTGSMYTEEFLEDLQSWWEMQDQEKYEKESMDADFWDKNGITLDDWISIAKDDIRNNNTHNWTRIPDSVTDYLKFKGYDGIKDQGGKNGGTGHTVWIPFTSEQIKSAEPITYDDDGKIIPPSERFNNEKKDIRWSRWTEQSMDVNAWLENASISTFQTEDELIMWQAWKNLRMNIRLSLERQLKYQDQIRLLESKTELTAEEREELTKLRNRLDIQKEKMAGLEEELQKVLSDEGYAGMMYRNNVVLGDYIAGKTQDQVRQTVEQMVKEVQQAKAEIEKQTAELKKLAETQAVKTMQSFFGKTSLKKMAGMLRKFYNSKISKAEVENRLAEMALKQARGESITEDCMALAVDLVDKIRGVQSEAIEQLRGTTFVIGESLQKELKAQNTSLKEIRSRVKGSGVQFVTNTKNKDGVVVDKHSRISEQWEELRNNNNGLPDVSDMPEIQKLETIVDFIANEMAKKTGAEQYNIDMDEAALFVRSAVGNVTTFLVDNPQARGQIENLMKQIQELSGKTEKIAGSMEELSRKMEDVENAGIKAKGWTTVLQRDVNDAINYYNKMAGVAARYEKNKVREKLIEQLKSENTAKLIRQQRHYQEMIQKDRNVRELAQDNKMLRQKIHTVASRMANRLFAETDQKNVPEETKPLVRMVLGMLEKNDSIYQHVMLYNRKQMVDIHERLEKMNALNGPFDFNEDLNWLIQNPGPDQDTAAKEAVEKTLLELETGLNDFRLATGKGQTVLTTMRDRKAALEKVQQAVSTIWNVVKARGEMEINGRRMQVIDMAVQMASEMQDREYKGERTGKRGLAREKVAGAVGYGNLTPEYFFKNLKNSVMSLLKKGLDNAENRGGLEAYKAKQRVAQIVQDTGYGTWDGQEKHEVAVRGKRTVTMTTEQIMALYATWKRESNALRPEETSHLLHGGFMLTVNRMDMKNGRVKMDRRPIRMTKDNLNNLASYLTEEQKTWVDQIVDYMSNDLAELGNEASMQMYGIRKFTEQYYFPIKSWEGVMNKRSDAGVQNSNENRAAQQSFSKRIRSNANNTIEIGDFTATAMKHIAGMINYNTVAPAIENMNKVLNQQLEYGEKTEEYDDTYKMNMRALFEEKYGMLATNYLKRFMKDMNGGIAREGEKSLKETLLTTFRKGAVAGSLSVAAQQPLSYIRAAMMINPVYMARAILPTHWGRIHEEMMKYSGLAVIKDMGRFDMNQGRSMIDFITPEESMSKARRIGQKAMDATTVLPEKMDQITWGRLWIACKLETQAQNPEMDPKSEEFMLKTAERFNDLMRRTQVYDSVMVKSQNMRSTNYAIKSMTSFMAEPTLTLNVLADAVRNFNSKGGKLNMAKAGATFVLSAAAQALVKALMSTGRSPDKKKTWEEQFLTKWFSLFLGEANPLTLVPGFNDMIELLKYGEISDDAMGVIGKLKNMILTTINWASGKNKDHYKNFEDTVGQMAQIFTNVPLKNLMRDARAIYNFFAQPYAKRDSSGAVLKYGILDSIHNADNIMGTINFYLDKAEAGYGTTNNAYYDRIYQAMTSGDKQRESELREYLTLGKGVSEKAMKQNMSTRINAAGKSGEMTGPEIVQQKLDNGASVATIKSWITSEYKAQYIAADTEGRRKLMNELTKMYKLIGVSGEDAMKIVQKWVKDEKKKE